MIGLLSKFKDKMQKLVGHAWYVPLIALLAALDSFLVIFPIEALLISHFLFARKNWLRSAILVALGSAIGCLFLAGFIKIDLHIVLDLADIQGIKSWQNWPQGSGFVHHYGAVGVAFVAMTFIPLQIAVAVATWEKVPLVSIFLAALLGRGLKYSLYGIICIYFPKLVKRLRAR